MDTHPFIISLTFFLSTLHFFNNKWKVFQKSNTWFTTSHCIENFKIIFFVPFLLGTVLLLISVSPERTPLIKGLEKLKEIAMSQGLYNTSLDKTIKERSYPENVLIHPSDGAQTTLPLKWEKLKNNKYPNPMLI